MYLNLNFHNSAPVDKQLSEFIGSSEIIIFENDTSLDDSILNFYGWCVENKKQVNIIYAVSSLPMEYIEQIIAPDTCIAFLTTGKSKRIGEILTLISTLKGYRLKAIECYVCNPVFSFIPDECSHVKVLSLDSYQEEVSKWEMNQLTTR